MGCLYSYSVQHIYISMTVYASSAARNTMLGSVENATITDRMRAKMHSRFLVMIWGPLIRTQYRT